MSRGPVPDRPPTRPTVPEVVALARAYYAKPENECGGSLHIVLDDENLEDGNVEYCRDYARERGDEAGVALAEKILAMSRTQRQRLVRRYDEYRHPWPGPLARALGAS